MTPNIAQVGLRRTRKKMWAARFLQGKPMPKRVGSFNTYVSRDISLRSLHGVLNQLLGKAGSASDGSNLVIEAIAVVWPQNQPKKKCGDERQAKSQVNEVHLIDANYLLA